jgi:hypothetical protein
MFGVASSSFAGKTYTDNGDGTVTDATTGLTWVRCAQGTTLDLGICSGTASSFTWDQANALTASITFAGQSDWRLPTIRELQTIVDRSKVSPAIDLGAFPDTPSSNFWSGTPDASFPAYAWGVVFDDGVASSYDSSNPYFVRLVRGGQPFGSLLNIARPSNDYVDLGDGTVTHRPTSLMWKRCAEGQLWSSNTCNGEASRTIADQAAALSAGFAGYTDWRLPTAEELLSLVDYSGFNPAVNSTIFPATPSASFWSSSRYAYGTNGVWGVGFYDGGVSNRFGLNAVRLVRSDHSFDSYAFSVSKTGNGSLTSTPAAIACGSICSASLSVGTRVDLTASPDLGSTFVGWSGACTGSGTCSVTMNAAKSVGAIFKPIPFTVATTGVTAGVIPAGVANVTSKISFNSEDVGKTGAVFITAVVPSSFLSSLPLSQSGVMAPEPMAAATPSGSLVLVQLTSAGWTRVAGGLLTPYASGVLGVPLSAQTILTNANTSNLSGAQFCVGYGTSASEMSEASRMQQVATVPDASAASVSRQSCLVTDSLQVQAGWNLLGNSRRQIVQAANLYSDAGWVTAVWGWDSTQRQWQIYAPSLDASALQSLIKDKGYGALGEINPGDGYWVQATAPASVMLQAGTPFELSNANLIPGWNLVTTTSSQTPAGLNAIVENLTSLWAWDSVLSQWYFYAPSLDKGMTLADYIRTNGYLDFVATGMTVGHGVGFWVRRQ